MSKELKIDLSIPVLLGLWDHNSKGAREQKILWVWEEGFKAQGDLYSRSDAYDNSINKYVYYFIYYMHHTNDT